MEKFSKGKAIAYGWETMRKNFWFFCGLLITAFAVQLVPNLLSSLCREKMPVLAFFLALFSSVAGVIVAIGLIKVSLKLYDGKERPRIADLFSTRGIFWKYIVASSCLGLATLAGIVLLIIPGFIISIRCQFFGYLIVDRQLGPVQALKKSFAMTRGNGWNLFWFGFLTVGITLLGVLALLVGLFAAVPVTVMATAFVYRFLTERSGLLEKAPV